MNQRSYNIKVSKSGFLTLSKSVINEQNGFSVGDNIKVEVRIDPEGNVIWSKDISLPSYYKVRIPKKVYIINPSVDLFITVTKLAEDHNVEDTWQFSKELS